MYLYICIFIYIYIYIYSGPEIKTSAHVHSCTFVCHTGARICLAKTHHCSFLAEKLPDLEPSGYGAHDTFKEINI